VIALRLKNQPETNVSDIRTHLTNLNQQQPRTAKTKPATDAGA